MANLISRLFNEDARKIKKLEKKIQPILELEETYKNMSDDELKAMSWTTFAAGCTQPELVQYLKERRLYVNEPVESEEEV